MGGIVDQHDQHADDEHVERTPTEARQSVMTGHMRYVLGVSLTLAVLAMAIIYLSAF